MNAVFPYPIFTSQDDIVSGEASVPSPAKVLIPINDAIPATFKLPVRPVLYCGSVLKPTCKVSGNSAFLTFAKSFLANSIPPTVLPS